MRGNHNNNKTPAHSFIGQKTVLKKISIPGILFFIISILVYSYGCEKIRELLTFNIKNESSFQVNRTVPFNTPFDIMTPEVPTSSQKEFENNKTSSSLVKDVKLTRMNLSITTPQGETFGFLKSIRIYISTAEGADEKEIAYINDIDPNSTQIDLLPTGINLDKYIKASSYKLRTAVVTRQVITEDITIKCQSTFKVTANL